MPDAMTVVQEGKAAATNRLRKEGRWDEASAYKDQVRAELKREGMKAEEAKEESWRRMIEASPPLPPVPGPTESERFSPLASLYADEIAELAQERAGKTPRPVDVLRDFRWVYENLFREDVRPKNAPSLGAWNLWEWAHQNVDEFYTSYLPKIMRMEEREAEKTESAAEPPRITKHDQQLMDDIRRQIKELSERAMEESEYDLRGTS